MEKYIFTFEFLMIALGIFLAGMCFGLYLVYRYFFNSFYRD